MHNKFDSKVGIFSCARRKAKKGDNQQTNQKANDNFIGNRIYIFTHIKEIRMKVQRDYLWNHCICSIVAAKQWDDQVRKCGFVLRVCDCVCYSPGLLNFPERFSVPLSGKFRILQRDFPFKQTMSRKRKRNTVVDKYLQPWCHQQICFQTGKDKEIGCHNFSMCRDLQRGRLKFRRQPENVKFKIISKI